MQSKHTSVVLADDHVLLRKGLAGLINSFDGFSVLFETDNGQQLVDQLDPNNLPALALLDINMPVKDGYETALWLKEHYPGINVLALSMYDHEQSIIRMIRNGAKGYLLKDTHPKEFKTALETVMTKGFYYSEMVTGKLIHAVNAMDDNYAGQQSFARLNDRETEFLKLACTEMTYKEIADKMCLSPRTIDGYRDALFEKLEIKTRVGLVMYAIRNGIVNVH
jgi:two-component system invasion response regulator UvrY